MREGETVISAGRGTLWEGRPDGFEELPQLVGASLGRATPPWCGASLGHLEFNGFLKGRSPLHTLEIRVSVMSHQDIATGSWRGGCDSVVAYRVLLESVAGEALESPRWLGCIPIRVGEPWRPSEASQWALNSAPVGSVSGLFLLCPASLGRDFRFETEGPPAPRGLL
jgi:hypothetical protein